jgi:hypothetical protein
MTFDVQLDFHAARLANFKFADNSPIGFPVAFGAKPLRVAVYWFSVHLSSNNELCFYLGFPHR